MRKRLSADREAAPVSSATANALSASPMMPRVSDGGAGCWLALTAPPCRGGGGWLEPVGNAPAPPPVVPLGPGELGAGSRPNPPPPVGPWPLPGALAAPLADRTLLSTPVLECAIAAPVIATAAAPTPSPTPTAAKSPPVKVVAPPRIADASLGDIQHTA